MLFQLDFSCLKSKTENQLKSNVGKPLKNSMVWAVLQGENISLESLDLNSKHLIHFTQDIFFTVK